MNQYLRSLWLTETVRLIEKDNGRFQDEDANRQARAIDGLASERIIKRATTISEQNGLQSIQKEWLSGAKLSFVILTGIAIFAGAGLAFSALTQNPINLYWALLCLLGAHFITLFLWIISCIFLPSESGSLFIHIWLWLTKKLSRKNSNSQLLPAFIELFGKKIRWLIGLIVNLLWFVVLFSALIVLVALLSTKHYSFEWQTTLLSADAVITITRFLGEIPAFLGFTLPDIDMIRSSEQAISAGDVRSAWAIWLLGIFIVYGIFIRLILFIFCWLKWIVVCQQITLNTQYPEYQLLINDIEPYMTKSIIDEDIGADGINHYRHVQPGIQGSTDLLVAIEVNENWLAPDEANFLGFLNNSEQQKTILDFLQQHPAQRLLIAIDSDRSPDRGIINLILVLASKSEQCRLWFINQGRQFNNWKESTKKLSLEEATVSWLSK